MKTTVKVRVRLAPSPTGNLHIGTARTALFNWLFARKNNGSFLLRIEDTDKERSKDKYLKNILEGLKWLGLEWDEDPILQSQRNKAHWKAIQFLLKKGLAYRCYATEEELSEMREQQISSGKAPKYDNRHRNLSPEKEKEFIDQGRTSVIRFRIEDEEFIQWNDMIRGKMTWQGKDLGGDMVISRRASADEIGDPLYNLVVVVDDNAMNITHVIRGEDHIANTAKQILLYRALDQTIPVFAHAPLILNLEGKKLSKRDGVTSISDFKSMGFTSEALANYMTLLGWSPPEGMDEKFTLQDASKVFGFERVNKASAKFDWEKLKWLNSQVIHNLSKEKLLEFIEPLWIEKNWSVPSSELGLELIELIRPSLTLLNDSLEQSLFFFEEPTPQEDAIMHLKKDDAKKALNLVLNEMNNCSQEEMNIEKGKEIINIVSKSGELKKGMIMKSLRAAFMGSMQGPDLLSSWTLLSKAGKADNRIKSALS